MCSEVIGLGLAEAYLHFEGLSYLHVQGFFYYFF